MRASSENYWVVVRGLPFHEPDLRLLLGEALGLDGMARARLLRARRDHHLRQAAARLLPDGRPFACACRLAPELRRFEAIVWPRLRHLPAPPAGASELRAHLWHVLHIGLEVPTSERHLHRILTAGAGAVSEATE
jgi:hypothetical protein